MIKPVILCVDDDEIVLQSLKAQIKKFFGSKFRVELAENGNDALRIVNDLVKKKIDLPVVISDHIMPGMNGDELLSDIYKLSKKTLNIMLTGHADPQAVGNAVNNAKLFRYLSKPWNSYDMNMTIKEAIRSFFLDKEIEDQKRKLAELVIQLGEYNETLEEKVEDRTEEIGKQKDTLKATYEKLLSLSEFKDIMTNMIAHDMKNLLNSILLLSNTAQEPGKDMNDIFYAGSQMLNLVNNMIDVQKFEETEIQLKIEEYELKEIIEDVKSQIRIPLQAKNINLEFKIPKSIKLKVDKPIIIRVLVNIVINAIKYSKAGKHIAISVKKPSNISPHCYQISIADEGVGISDDILPFIFDKFFQSAPRSLKNNTSSGLGLTFCKLAMEAHGGQLTVTSTPEVGTTFTALIPV